MKYLKRARASIVSLMMGESKTHIIPTVALSFVPPEDMSVSQFDGQNNLDIPKYEVTGIQPVDHDTKNTMVKLMFKEVIVEDAEEFEPAEYSILVPIHYISIANALSIASPAFTMIGLDKSENIENYKKIVDIHDVLFALSFPANTSEEYSDIIDTLSALVSNRFLEPLTSETIERSGTGIDSMPVPPRLAQLAIFPLLASLAEDEVLTLRTVIAMEPLFNAFHERNHNPDLDTDDTAHEYVTVMDVNGQEPIDEDLEEREDENLSYSILARMNDAMRYFLMKNEPHTYSREYYEDATIFVFLANMRAIYQRNNSDSFLTTQPIVSEDRQDKATPGLHKEFMSLANDSLSGIFNDIDENMVPRTAIEQLWATDLNKWRESPANYWPSAMSRVEEELRSLTNADVYFDIMAEPISDEAKWNSLVKTYGLGAVMTSIIIKTAINLIKFKEIAEAGHSDTLPPVIIASRWLTKPEDDYVWEIPSLAYNVATHNSGSFISLMTFQKTDYPVYLALMLGRFISVLILEEWNRESMEPHLVTSGMPAQYQEMFLKLVDEINNFEVDPEEFAEYEFDDDENAVRYFTSMRIEEDMLHDEDLDVAEVAKMIAYAIPALADIHVASHTVEDEVEEMGSLSWQRHRVSYVQSLFEMIVDNVERKDI